MRTVPSLLLASALVIVPFASPAAAKDRNVAVRPSNTPEIEILEPAEWRGEATRIMTVRPGGFGAEEGEIEYPTSAVDRNMTGTA